MHHPSEQQQMILECECGERIVLIGSKEGWISRHPVFRCECGRKLTIDGRAEEEVFAAS